MDIWQACFADRMQSMRASEIRELLKLLDQPDIISFAGGIPDPALFPRAGVQAAYAEVLADPASLQYSVSEGYRPLREWLAQHMAGAGVPCGPDNIFISSGSQQALDYLGKLLLDAGDTVLTTWPTYLGALQAFNAYQPAYDRLTLEGGNRTPESYLATAADAGSKVTCGYLTPDFSNPTGETLSLEGRHRLLDLVHELGVPVIEDAAYRLLRYQGADLPSLLALDVARSGGIEQSRIIYSGSFSKILAPGLRVGWVCAASPVIQKLVLIKQAGDLHSPTINQMVVNHVARRVLDEQVTKVRAVYGERCAAMLAALERHMPKGTSWSRPDGGMFVWVTLPPELDGRQLLVDAVQEARVAFVPGIAFFPDGTGANTIRLSFSLADPATIEEGIARLGRIVAAKAAA